MYRRNRYYDPTTGRFTQEDPAGLAGGINAYGFGNGDPINSSDPFGLCSYSDGFKDCDRKDGCHVPSGSPNDATPFYLAVTGLLVGGAVGEGTAALLSEASSADGQAEGAAAAQGPATVTVSKSKYPESAAHIEDAQAAGQPSVLTIDRAGAAARRGDALEGVPVVKGMDRDEYPPAMFREGGAGSSVRYVTPRDNRGAGACIGNQCRALPDATQVQVKVVPEE